MQHSFFHRLLELIAPSSCSCCGRRLSQSEQQLCAVCLMQLPLTRHHLTPLDNEMARMFWGLCPIEKAAALYYHIPHASSARIIYAMKYYGRDDLAQYMGQRMAESFGKAAFFEGVTALVPVPLSAGRRRLRGYNQSALIARGMSSVIALPVREDWLWRVHFRKSQTQLLQSERQDNVAGAFEARRGLNLEREHVMLIDDVATTGATLRACADALAGAGCRHISVATLCLSKY